VSAVIFVLKDTPAEDTPEGSIANQRPGASVSKGSISSARSGQAAKCAGELKPAPREGRSLDATMGLNPVSVPNILGPQLDLKNGPLAKASVPCATALVQENAPKNSGTVEETDRSADKDSTLPVRVSQDKGSAPHKGEGQPPPTATRSASQPNQFPQTTINIQSSMNPPSSQPSTASSPKTVSQFLPISSRAQHEVENKTLNPESASSPTTTSNAFSAPVTAMHHLSLVARHSLPLPNSISLERLVTSNQQGGMLLTTSNDPRPAVHGSLKEKPKSKSSPAEDRSKDSSHQDKKPNSNPASSPPVYRNRSIRLGKEPFFSPLSEE